jgi:hypothetical protein
MAHRFWVAWLANSADAELIVALSVNRGSVRLAHVVFDANNRGQREVVSKEPLILKNDDFPVIVFLIYSGCSD